MVQTGSSNDHTPPAVDFSALILGFSSAALYYMGESALDGQPPTAQNFSLARQNIDILMLLRDKTAGNLLPEEAQLIAQLIADLQLKLVEAKKKV